MSREARFRAWDKRNQRWSMESLYIDEDGNLYEIEERSFAFENYMYKENVNDRYEVVWFTGRKDKNGVEIYEGHILKGKHYMNGSWHRIIGQVVFSSARFCIDGIGKYEGIMRIEFDPSYEVIGNIYETREDGDTT